MTELVICFILPLTAAIGRNGGDIATIASGADGSFSEGRPEAVWRSCEDVLAERFRWERHSPGIQRA